MCNSFDGELGLQMNWLVSGGLQAIFVHAQVESEWSDIEIKFH